jgi:hypothetical protein
MDSSRNRAFCSAKAVVRQLLKNDLGMHRSKITDLKCAVIGRNPVIRIVTDQGISGLRPGGVRQAVSQAEVLFYKSCLIGEDPTNGSETGHISSIRSFGSGLLGQRETRGRRFLAF